MSTQPSDFNALWNAVERAGGIDQYIHAQLSERGYLVARQATDTMSKKELAAYKKGLKEEALHRRLLKKQAWAAYKATHIVHLGEGVYWSDEPEIDRYDLDEPEARAAENELPALDSPSDLAKALGIDLQELRWLSYHRDVAKSIHYHRFTIPKRNGKERAIWAPMPKLKKVQRWIYHNIVERLPIHGSAHGFVAGRSILSHAKGHTDSKVILSVDIKDFFPSFTFRRVRGLFRKAGYREQIATLLALLCTEAPREILDYKGEPHLVALGPRCLPQGAPTSPAITNTICLSLDRRMMGLARKNGWRYSRYADDLSFSLPNRHKGAPKLGNLLGGIHAIVQDEGLVLNPEKTRVMRSGGRQRITGLIVNGAAEPRVPRKLRRQLRAAACNLGQGKELHEGESIARLAGYAAFVTMVQPEEGRELLGQFGYAQSAEAKLKER